MKRRNKKTDENYLDRIPNRASHLTWSENEDGLVTLNIENKGFFNRIAQKVFKRPKISHVHLDKYGSFVWLQIDGQKTIFDIGADVDSHFGEKSHPLYERLAKFFQILHSYGFVTFN